MRYELVEEFYTLWGAGLYLDEILKALFATSLDMIEEDPTDPEKMEMEKKRGSFYWFPLTQREEAAPLHLTSMGFLFTDFSRLYSYKALPQGMGTRGMAVSCSIAPMIAGEYPESLPLLPTTPEDLETAIRARMIGPRWVARMGVYNVGIAVRGEALGKLGEHNGVSSGKSLRLARDELPNELKHRAVLEPKVELLAITIRGKPCLIRRVGRLIFKGFEEEKPQLIGEWIPRATPEFSLFLSLVSSQGRNESLKDWLSR